MTAQAAETETFEDEYEEYDEFDDDDDERGLSGLVVLLMGVVMLGAFAAVVWIAYQQGIKTGGEDRAGTPYVAADPDPVKIENSSGAIATSDNERTVYDRFDGEASDDVEVLAEGPEEPVDRTSDDPIADIASAETADDEVVDDAVADRIASLAAADEELAAETVPPPPSSSSQTAATEPAHSNAQNLAQNEPAPASAQTTSATAAPAASSGDALSGSHLVQVGAFGSEKEAMGMWTRMQGKLGDYVAGKSTDVERADLGAKGVYYRLRVGPFASYDAANSYCSGLKTRGQDCLVKAK